MNKHSTILKVFTCLLCLLIFSSCGKAKRRRLHQPVTNNDLYPPLNCTLLESSQNEDLFLEALKENNYRCISQELYSGYIIKNLYSLSLHEKLIQQLQSFDTGEKGIISRIHFLMLHNYFLYFDSHDEAFETDRALNEKYLTVLEDFTNEYDDTIATSTLLTPVLDDYEFSLIWGVHVLSEYESIVVFLDFLKNRVNEGLSSINQYRALSTITHVMYKTILSSDRPESSNFYNGYTETFINWFLSLFNHNDNHVRKHAVYETRCFSKAHPDIKERVSQALLNFIDQGVEYWTRLWAVKSLTAYFEMDQDSHGNPLNLDDEKRMFMEQYMPTTLTLDHITYHSRMNRDQVMDLHNKLINVQEVFFEITHHTNPIHDDRNENLTIFIVDSPDHYIEYMPLFENLGSNNGGKYMENTGTIYTFERPDSTRFFTLEELLKHEYTHYLNDRYIIEGLYGNPNTAYDQDIDFFEEGLAEFFAGVEMDQGIVLRQTLINNIHSESPHFMNLDQLFKSSPKDGFRYYQYAYAFFYFLYSQSHMDIFHELIRSISENNYYFEDYENNSLNDNLGINLNDLNQAYRAYLNQLISLN